LQLLDEVVGELAVVVPAGFQYELHKTNQISNIQGRLFLTKRANQLDYPMKASPLPKIIKHVDHKDKAVKLLPVLSHKIRVVFE
jgi:hypothetical protein